MKEILITYSLFPLTQPNTLRVNANKILSYLSLWRGLLRTNVIKKSTLNGDIAFIKAF